MVMTDPGPDGVANYFITKSANQLLNVEIIRYMILIVSGVFAGYTLQPVPEWLNHLFDTSYVFKFAVIIAIGMVALYPLDDNEVNYIFIGSFLVLVMFMVFRKIDEQMKREKKCQELEQELSQ